MQGLGFALVAVIWRALCAAGLHEDLPVLVRRTPGLEYVLLRCERCDRDQALTGKAAAEWLTRFTQG